MAPFNSDTCIPIKITDMLQYNNQFLTMKNAFQESPAKSRHFYSVFIFQFIEITNIP